MIVAVRDAGNISVNDYGEPMAGWGDQSNVLGLPTHFRGLLHRDGVRIDFTIWPAALLQRVADAEALPADLDVGYRVLLDKDGATNGWTPPSYRAHIPGPPTQDEYDALVHEFWWSTTYVAKALWRGELFFAKYILEHDVKGTALRRMLEWRIELDHDWTLRPGAYGRGLESRLAPELWAELEATYVGVDPDENWEALFRTAALFRRVANEVSDDLGLTYPQADDDGVTAFLEGIRELPR